MKNIINFKKFNEEISLKRAAAGLALATGLALNPSASKGQITGTDIQKYEMPKTAKNLVGKVKRGPILIADLSYEDTNSDRKLYTLRFLDANTSYRNTGLKTEVLESIKFAASDQEINSLHSFLHKMLDQPNTFSQEVNLGENRIKVVTQKVGFGIAKMVNVALHVNDTMVFGLSEKEIDKLFDK